MSPRPTNIRWLVFALACATSWMLYLHRYTFNFIGPALTREYGYTPEQVGAMFGLFYVTYGVFQIPAGLACDVRGTRLFLALSICLWSLALSLFGTTGNVRVLTALRLFFGGAQAGAYPALAKISRSWFPQSVRTTMQGVVATTSGRLGGAMSPIVMATLLMGYGGLSWRAALWVMSGAGILLAAALTFLFRETPELDGRVNNDERALILEGETAAESSPAMRPALPWRQALRSWSLAALSIQQALAAGADAIYVYLMGPLFLDRYGVDIKSAGLYASLPLIGGAIGGLAGGWLNDRARGLLGIRWGRSAIGFAGPLVASLMMLAVTRQSSALAAGLGLFAVKFFVDWNQPTTWGAASDLGGRFTGTAFAIVNTAGTVTSVLCPLLFGRILHASTTDSIVSGRLVQQVDYGPLLTVIATIYAACGITWLVIDCRQRLDAGV
jgi:MFS transporter, ACS family, glucarate transporter